MTKYWTQNSCAISQNTIFKDWNAQGYRKGLYTELFFLFFIYFITKVLQALVYKHQRKSSAQQKQLRAEMSGGDTDSNRSQAKNSLPWHSIRWTRQFTTIFSTHCISIGMCVLFSPFAGSMTIAYIHLFLFFLFCFMEFKTMIFPAKIVRILMDMCNLTLILIGTASLNLNRCNADFTCKGVDAGVLTKDTCF